MSNGVRCGDPTREDMLAFLVENFGDAEGDLYFNVEEAIYWFAADWYDGQWSNLYRALSASPYRPGILTDRCEPGGFSEIMYNALVGEYVNG